MKPKREYAMEKPLTKPGKRSTPTYLLSPRQRKKRYKAERRLNSLQIIVDDPLPNHPNSPANRIKDFEQGIW